MAATAGAGAGLAGFAVLHLLMADVVDPLRDPVSAYALTQPGSALFAVGALGYALACLVLAVRTGLGGTVRWLLGVTGLMFVLVVLFPTDAGAEVSTVAGQVHRYAAGAAFVMLTLAGAGCARDRWTMPVLTTLSAAMLVVTALNTFAPWLADGGDWRGLPQRGLLVVHAAMVVAVAWRDRHVRNETAARLRAALRARWAFWRQAVPQYLAGRPVVAVRMAEPHTSQRGKVSL